MRRIAFLNLRTTSACLVFRLAANCGASDQSNTCMCKIVELLKAPRRSPGLHAASAEFLKHTSVPAGRGLNHVALGPGNRLSFIAQQILRAFICIDEEYSNRRSHARLCFRYVLVKSQLAAWASVFMALQNPRDCIFQIKSVRVQKSTLNVTQSAISSHFPGGYYSQALFIFWYRGSISIPNRELGLGYFHGTICPPSR